MQVAARIQVDPSLPRMTGRQQHRSNIPAATAHEYYKRVLTIPMLDYLISEMEDRLHSDSSAMVSQIMLLLPSTLAERQERMLTSADIVDLVQLYGDDFAWTSYSGH